MISIECHEISNGRPSKVSLAHLRHAMYGFDPLSSNPLEWPDFGVRGQIFKALTQVEEDTITISNFFDITRDYIYCNAQLSEMTIKNYHQYQEYKRSSFKFGSYEATQVGNFSFESSFGLGVSNTKNELEILDYFKNGIGEIVTSAAECITHTVSLSPFVIPPFTKPFTEGLRELHRAALGDLDDTQKTEIFVAFVKNYGTHYMSTTHMGSKIMFEKRFSSFSTNPEQERKRQNCVRKAAEGYLQEGVDLATPNKNLFSDVLLNCTRAFEVKESQPDSSFDEKILSVGTLPSKNVREWNENSKDNPTPVRIELESILSLLKDKFLRMIPSDTYLPKHDKLNATAIHDFFRAKLANYCTIMTGQDSCNYQNRGCGLNSECPFKTRCINNDTEPLGYNCQQENGCGFNSECPNNTKCINDEEAPMGYKCQCEYGKSCH